MLRERLQNEVILARRAREEVALAAPAQTPCPRGEKSAAELIADILFRLMQAAKGEKTTLDIMTLSDRHYDGDGDELMRIVELCGMREVVLKGAAASVAAWLKKENITVGLREDREHDESQGRSWSKIVLVASWPQD